MSIAVNQVLIIKWTIWNASYHILGIHIGTVLQKQRQRRIVSSWSRDHNRSGVTLQNVWAEYVLRIC
jgi:hypothetical protein